MVKPLAFKGDKKAPKKRKRAAAPDEDDTAALVPTSAKPAADEETWVSADAFSDISGPILLVLPSSPPTCLATDSLGKVFASRVENLVENDPASAEPHDVRQVWVAQRIVGSEDQFTFKGHHGKYLTSNHFGLLSSTREAVSPEETFTAALAPTASSGLFTLRTTRGTYLSSDSTTASAPEPRGDADDPELESCALRVRMQARFKPKLQSAAAEKVRSKISRKELEAEVGRRLEDGEVKKLKKARREGDYHEAMLDVKVKGKHDKYA